MKRIAIVGRPNVGKSSLFNRLVGKKAAVVADEPGVTRDVKEELMLYDNHRLLIIDTGGLLSNDEWAKSIEEKVEMAIQEADVVLFVVDGRSSLTASDYDIARWLRRLQKPILLVASKIDSHKHETEMGELYALGFGEPFPTSAEHGRGFGDLMDHILSLLPEDDEDIDPTSAIRIALIGRPNVGKSSLTNAIIGSERVIVSEIPGTTRDSIDISFDYGGQKFVLVDTAGIRHRPADNIELFAQLRSERAIQNAHIVILVIDPFELGDHEQKLANKAYDAGKPVILALNKWDLVEGHEKEREINQRLNHLTQAPRVLTSAVEHQGLHQLLAETARLFEIWHKRIPTADLNRWLEICQIRQPVPNFKGKPLKMLFMTQAEVAPPTFVFFCNRADFVTRAYEGFLKNRLIEDFEFEGVPIRFVWRERVRRER